MWIDPKNLSTYRSHSEIQLAFPNVSFPSTMFDADFESVGLKKVSIVSRPAFDPITQEVVELTPINDGAGNWHQAWETKMLDPEQAAANLAQARAARRGMINTWRLQANRGSFAHGGKLFACDELSRSDIDGITSFVTLAGSLPPGWPGAWKAIDNSHLPITSVADWTAFVASMVAAGNANFAKSQALKAAVDAATTTSQINSITW